MALVDASTLFVERMTRWLTEEVEARFATREPWNSSHSPAAVVVETRADVTTLAEEEQNNYPQQRSMTMMVREVEALVESPMRNDCTMPERVPVVLLHCGTLRLPVVLEEEQQEWTSWIVVDDGTAVEEGMWVAVEEVEDRTAARVGCDPEALVVVAEDVRLLVAEVVVVVATTT